MGMQKLLEYCRNKFLSITGYDQWNWTEFATFMLIPVFCFLLEMILTGWKKSSLHRLVNHFKESSGDMICFILEAAHMFRLIGVLMTFGICYWLTGQTQRNLHLNLLNSIQIPALTYIILILIGDFKNYAKHYIFHKWGFGWKLHSYHHSAEHFTILTFHRFHFVEQAVGMLFDVIPFVLLGAGPADYLYISILRETHQHLLHSQLRSDWGFIGAYILVSPAAHWIHHSADQKHFDKNFGITFIFWDRLFGTYLKPEKVERLGIPENPFDKSNFILDIFSSYRNALSNLLRLSGNQTL